MKEAGHFATCRGCGDSFKKSGYGAPHALHPRLCRDCVAREFSSHPWGHVSQTKCVAEYL